MSSTDDDLSHEFTLNLLAEVGNYLSRLPAHPMTRAMHQRVQAHLDNPLAKVRRDEMNVRTNAEKNVALIKSGLSFWGLKHITATGAPLIHCRLLHPALRIESPAYQHALSSGEDAEAMLLQIATEIAQGVTISLSQDLLASKMNGMRTQLADGPTDKGSEPFPSCEN